MVSWIPTHIPQVQFTQQSHRFNQFQCIRMLDVSVHGLTLSERDKFNGVLRSLKPKLNIGGGVKGGILIKQFSLHLQNQLCSR